MEEIKGEKSPAVGTKYKYSISANSLSTKVFQKEVNVVYVWRLYKQKDEKWIDITDGLGKQGTEAIYEFSEKSENRNLHLVVYKVNIPNPIYRLSTKSDFDKLQKEIFASLFLKPVKAEKKEIKKIILFNKGAKNVDEAGLADTLTAQAYCVGMFNKKVNFYVWKEGIEENKKKLRGHKTVAIDKYGYATYTFKVSDIMNFFDDAIDFSNSATNLFVTVVYEDNDGILSLTNKKAVVVVREKFFTEKVKDYISNALSASKVSYTEPPKTEEKNCFCNRDFEESDIRTLVKLLKKKEILWEGYKTVPCNIDDKSFERLTKELNATFKKYGINACSQKLHFFAQACHETGVFTISEETWGNTESSQSEYKGRGVLQMTGERKDNSKYYDEPGPFKTYGSYAGINSVTNPELLSDQITYCIDSGGWMFSIFKKMVDNENAQVWEERWKGHKEKTIGKSLNELALYGDEYLELISALLNGRNSNTDMPNGWGERKLYYELLRNTFFEYDRFHSEKKEIIKEEKKEERNEKLLFPFRKMPYNHPKSLKNKNYSSYDYTKTETNAATFGYIRGKDRIHAARDLYYDPEEPIYSIFDGIVKNVYSYYYDTWAIEIEHNYEYKKGHKLVALYGEVNKNGILVEKDDKVKRGDLIAKVGLLVPNIIQPAPDKRGMLHFELYTGEATGLLSVSTKYSDMLYAKSINYSKNRSFKRRKDLFDPLELLDEMLLNSKNEGYIK